MTNFYEKLRKQDEAIIQKLDPNDYFVENVHKAGDNIYVKFTLKENAGIYIYFTIDESEKFKLLSIYHRTSTEIHARNISLTKNECEALLKKVWNDFFNHHKNDEKLKAFRLRYMFSNFESK